METSIRLITDTLKGTGLGKLASYFEHPVGDAKLCSSLQMRASSFEHYAQGLPCPLTAILNLDLWRIFGGLSGICVVHVVGETVSGWPWRRPGEGQRLHEFVPGAEYQIFGDRREAAEEARA